MTITGEDFKIFGGLSKRFQGLYSAMRTVDKGVISFYRPL